MNKPLEGLRVIELGTHVAIPKAARMMADWGAEVIKVEPPSGEPWRTIGRVWAMPYTVDNNPVFQSENANKKSVCINLKTAEGKEAMMKLLATADIFMTNTRPEPLEKLGFDYESLREKLPKIIYAHFSGFGQKGKDKDRAGFDVAAFWARGGMPVEWTLEGNTPFKPHAGFGDGTVASIILAGILAALYRREKTGLGEQLQTSLFAASLWYNSTGVAMGQPQYGHKYPKTRVQQATPLAPLYQTKDGDWILISEANWDGRIAGILEMFHLEQYIGNPKFMTIEAARKNQKELIALFDEAFANMSTEEVLAGLSALDVVHEKLANPRDLYQDEQAWANGYLYNLKLENGSEVVLPANPIQFSSMGPAEFNLAPQLGQDSADILKSLGYSEVQIAEMAASKAIATK